MNKLSLRILAMLMAVLMILTVSSIVVFADETDVPEEDGLMTITSLLGAEGEGEGEGEGEETVVEIDTLPAEETLEETAAETVADEETTAAAEETTTATEETVKPADSTNTGDTTTTGSEETKSNWFKDHISFVIAMGIIVTLVSAYFIARLVSVKFREKSTNFWKDYRSQFNKLSWPSKEQFWKNAAVVFSAIIIFGVILALLDLGISKLVYVLKDLMDLILPAGK